MAGLVYSENHRLDKPGMSVDPNISLTIKGNDCPYVSRGGLKLEKALREFNVSMEEKVLLDVGASTGGFTDCALRHGAHLSYAIDVGYNQLHWKLRNDNRVVVMERTNFRYVTPEMLLKDKPNIATIDVSFISLQLILPVLKNLLVPNSDVIALIKPQFEAGKNDVSKGGIVKEPKIQQQVIEKVISFAKDEQYQPLNLTYSPITGGKGNIEYLVHFGWKKDINAYQYLDIKQVINDAHRTLS